MPITQAMKTKLLEYQKNEITEHHVYRRLAKRIPSPENRKILERIAEDELRHYHKWKEYTERDVAPARCKVWFFSIISRLFGFTFGVKLLEKGEEGAQEHYRIIAEDIPGAEAIVADETEHEEALIALLDEERLRYTGSMILGLNDALVELTGALAGLTLALQNTRLVALTGLITGIAAALSMAASEYLSTKTEETTKDPLKASLYTGAAYIVTVFILILPYLFLKNAFVCLGFTLAAAILIIAGFNYYISVATDEPFRRRFVEMAGLSLAVAALSFGIGYLIRAVFGIDV